MQGPRFADPDPVLWAASFQRLQGLTLLHAHLLCSTADANETKHGTAFLLINLISTTCLIVGEKSLEAIATMIHHSVWSIQPLEHPVFHIVVVVAGICFKMN